MATPPLKPAFGFHTVIAVTDTIKNQTPHATIHIGRSNIPHASRLLVGEFDGDTAMCVMCRPVLLALILALCTEAGLTPPPETLIM